MDILTLPALPAPGSTPPTCSASPGDVTAGRSRSNSVTKEGTPASHAHDTFASYLRRTKNTICGRHPIGVLLGALGIVERDGLWSKGRSEEEGIRMQFVRYEHSSECENMEDSSVSYASAYVVF
jgi:MEMO1 family protein